VSHDSSSMQKKGGVVSSPVAGLRTSHNKKQSSLYFVCIYFFNVDERGISKFFSKVFEDINIAKNMTVCLLL
jgi:hypothetical protein